MTANIKLIMVDIEMIPTHHFVLFSDLHEIENTPKQYTVCREAVDQTHSRLSLARNVRLSRGYISFPKSVKALLGAVALLLVFLVMPVLPRLD